MKREDVYKLIDGERDYQDAKWNSSTTTSDGIHSVEEWIVYIEDYLNEAKHILARLDKKHADVDAMIIMRKVAAMAVCAMEQHDTQPRYGKLVVLCVHGKDVAEYCEQCFEDRNHP
jgi:hypothetical protein